MGVSPPRIIGGEPNQPRPDEARMRTNSRSRGCGLALAVLTLVVSLPELARAQQTGLFPNMNIRRQRVPCDQEDPIYKVYKHQYYGYHPTCWRPFPNGWGCPSREGPNREQSFKDIPLSAGERLLDTEDQPRTDEMQPLPGTTRPGLPALPGGARSPFEDEPDQARPGTAPPIPRGGQNPRQMPQGDPFELDKPDTPAAPTPGQPRPPGPGAASNGPELSAPALTPAATQGARPSQNQTNGDASARDDDGPLLALPSVNLAPVNDPGVPFGTQPPPPAADTNSSATATTASSAPRRGFLSGFFSNLGANWARR
jgi:hypothetical protein